MRGTTLVCLLGLAALAAAFSGTVPPTCDAHADFGCSLWNLVEGVPDRFNCTDASPGIMPWAAKPVHTDLYSLRTGDGLISDDPTVYIPGQFMTLHLRTLAHDQKYRGLLLYAVDSAGDRVGEWAVLEADKHFWAPWQGAEGDPCQQSVMHASAAIKPFHTYFRFMGPPVGTGDVTFVALIKTGSANTGEFYYPNPEGELTISEGVSTSSETDLTWVVSELGESCNEACEAVNRECESAEMDAITSAQLLQAEITPTIPCAYPLLSGCSDFTPSTGAEQLCYYKDVECASDGRPTMPTECTATSTDEAVGRLLCACAYVPPTPLPTPGPTAVPGAPSSSDSPLEPVESGASRLGPLLCLVGLLIAGGGRKSISTGLVVIVALMIFSAPASAHNWLDTNSRAPGASTILPCQTRRSSAPHVQVARNQYFQVEWSSGHEQTEVYFVLIRAEDADKMVEHHYLKLDAYLERSKAAGNDLSVDPAFHKYHRSQDESVQPIIVDGVQLGVYDSIVQPSDADFLERPIEFNARWDGPGVLWRYTEADRATDMVSVAFADQGDEENDAMPWILGVWRYFTPYHQSRQSDVAQFWIPQDLNLAEGEYILQYYWRGYGDCVDISYLDRDEPVEFVYGVYDLEGAELLPKRIDHCFFPEPQMYFAPPMQVPGGSVEACLQRCNQRNGCDGVNVFPIGLASSIYPQFRLEHDNIFWHQANDSLYPKTFNNVENPQVVHVYDNEESKELLRQTWDANPDWYLCLPIVTRERTDTEDKFIFSDDPEDPIFYSTCYEFDLKVDFIGYNVTAQKIEEGPWKFHDQCIDCEQRVRNYRDDTLPTWSVAEKCLHCDREPADPEPMVENGGMRLLRNDDAQCNEEGGSHAGCPEGFSCIKALIGDGWSRFNDVPSDPAACAALARADPECSNFVTTVTDTDHYFSLGCRCVKNTECCPVCQSRYSRGTGWRVWEIEPAPADPMCESGVLSEDGTACCSSTCLYGCVPDEINNRGSGVCCSNCIAEDRFCDEIGPPCYNRDPILPTPTAT